MNNLLYLTTKYWRKHIRSLFAVMFSGVLMVAVVVTAFLQMRAEFNRELHSYYDRDGMFDTIVFEPSDEFLAALTEGADNCIFGYINVLGKTGSGIDQYTYGWIDDPYGLNHITMESGRLPETENEVAIDRYVLDSLGWIGTPGDTITLDNGNYTVVGIIDESYQGGAVSEISNLVLNGFSDLLEYPTPVIIVGQPLNAEVQYSYTMVGNLPFSEFDDGYTYYYDLFEEFDTEYITFNDKDGLSSAIQSSFLTDNNFLITLAAVSGVISILSVFSVLRSVLNERQKNVRLLHRIGLSNAKINLMYLVECVFIIVVQTLAGFVVGSFAYLAIYVFQVNAMGMSDHSGFTIDKLVINYTYDPFIIAFIFSVVITALAFLAAALVSGIKQMRHILSRRAGTLFENFGRIFRQYYITIIQTFSMILICSGFILGYLYFIETTEKEDFVYQSSYEWGISPDYSPSSIYYNTDVGGLNLEEDGISEYYSAMGAGGIETGSFYMTDANQYTGIDDSIANALEGANVSGNLEQTFILSEEDMEYPNRIMFGTDIEKEYLASVSDTEYHNFFDEGQPGSQYLYKAPTMLTSRSTFDKLAEYVVEGEINIDKINSGEEIVFVTNGGSFLKVGDKITVGSAAVNNNYGIGDFTTNETTVGAIVKFDENTDRIISHVIHYWQAEQYYNLLTTVTGANALNFHNAAYTEIIAKDGIDGGLIPASAGFHLTGLQAILNKRFISLATQYGGMVLIITIMSLLGFAAYFNGIGVKINQKAYQISVLRAVGTPISKIRLRLFLDNIKIPVIAGFLSYFVVKEIQKLTEGGFQLFLQAWDAIQEYEKYVMLLDAELRHNIMANEIAQTQSQLHDNLSMITNQYFLDRIMWVVPVEQMTLLVVSIMCVITILLTVLALRKFKKNIADDLSKGRERQ